MATKNGAILIVGGGTFGTSTAYSLAQRGYTNVTVVDRSAPPSTEAAGNDINKVVRADYPDALYAGMATDAINIWRDPNGLFAGLYSKTGWILASSKDSAEWIRQSSETAGKLGIERAQSISTATAKRQWPVFKGEMKDWEAFWNPSAGWVNAREALSRMAKAAINRGVTYISGDDGHIKRLLFDEQGRCIGAKSRNGTSHYADRVVLAAGAYSAALLDMKDQLVAKGHCVGHIQLTPAEAARYKDMPLVAHLEGGLLFPPQEDNIVKISAMHFVTNYQHNFKGLSLPRYRTDNPGDGIPQPVERHLRAFVGQFLPELEHREWFETRICWDADMVDYHFLITDHPHHPGLSLACGGSAHGFKMFPVIGNYIADMLEGTLDPAVQQHWRWRPEAKASEETAEPFPTDLLDLNDVPGWSRSQARL